MFRVCFAYVSRGFAEVSRVSHTMFRKFRGGFATYREHFAAFAYGVSHHSQMIHVVSRGFAWYFPKAVTRCHAAGQRPGTGPGNEEWDICSRSSTIRFSIHEYHQYCVQYIRYRILWIYLAFFDTKHQCGETFLLHAFFKRNDIGTLNFLHTTVDA